MVGQNRASIIAQIGASTIPELHKPNVIDFGDIFDTAMKQYYSAKQNTRDSEMHKKQLEEMEREGQKSALALMNAQTQNKYLDNLRGTIAGLDLSPDEKAFAQAYPQEYMKNKSALTLLDKKLQSQEQIAKSRIFDTAKMKEFNKLRELYGDEVASAMVWGDFGQIQDTSPMEEQSTVPQTVTSVVFKNPNQKPTNLQTADNIVEQKELSKEVGKQKAKTNANILEAQKQLQNMENLNRILFQKNGLFDQANLGLDDNALSGMVQRNIPNWLLGQNTQTARQMISKTMGDIRLDELSRLKGAISDAEQQMIKDIVAGDISKYTPAEIRGTFNSIINHLRASTGQNILSSEDVIFYNNAIRQGYTPEEIHQYLQEKGGKQ